MEARHSEAGAIIKNHVMWSMGAGFIPVPVADVFAVSAVQLDMVRQLCKLYEIDYKDTELKAVVTSLTGSIIARVGARAIKFIPGVGSVIGSVTLAVLSGASTYALGEVFQKHFETGGTFLDFDPARLKKKYDELFEKGKSYAQEVRQEGLQREEVVHVEEESAEVGALLSRIKELGRLRDEGILSDDEFARLKTKLIDEA